MDERKAVTDVFRCSIDQAEAIRMAAVLDGLDERVVYSFIEWSLVYDNYRVFSLSYQSTPARVRAWNRVCDIASKVGII